MTSEQMNARRLDMQAWLRAAAIAASILLPGYYAFSDLRDTVLLLAERSDVTERRLARLEQMFEALLERQSARVPIFDRMVGQVDDHEKRLRQLELEGARGHP